MSSLLSPDSSHLLRRRRKLNNGKAAAAAAAAVLVLLPSGSAQHSAYPLIFSDPSSSLASWPTTPSPVSSPEVEFNPFVGQPDQPPDPDVHLDSPLSTSYPQHLATQIRITSSNDPTLTVKSRRAKLAKRASLETNPNTSPANLPEPFDTSLGTHFESSTCGPFIEHMVTDPEFQACHPFSLLLATSNGFFHSLRGTPGAPSLASVLSSTCAADVDACGILIDRFASLLSRPDACGSELEKHNALAVEALGGLQNFRLMRAAGCMQADAPTDTTGSNSTRLHPRASVSSSSTPAQSTPTTSSNETTADTNRASATPASSTNATNTPASVPSSAPTPPQSSQTYCFEAAANSSRPDDLYYYYLPSGTSLPSGTQPTCDTCTQTLMKLYSAAAANTSLGIHDTYPAARTVTNAHCGPGFAPAPANRANLANPSNAVPLVTLLFSLLLSAFL